jgi:hypothetical protein
VRPGADPLRYIVIASCVGRQRGRRARRPAAGFPGAGAEFQAAAGGADQFGPVAVRERPGGERAGPGPARGVPANLERAAAVSPAADRVNPDIERVHGNPLSQSPLGAAARVTGSPGLAARTSRAAGITGT